MLNLDALYRRYAADVFRFAVYLSGDPALAEDLTSETFIRAWTAREPVRVETIKAYLFTITRHLHLNGMRRRTRAVPLDPLEHDQMDPGADPEVRATQRAGLRQVLSALQTLPEADRAAVLMRAHDGMPYEEIAAALGLSCAAVKVKVHRARLRLAALRQAGEIGI